MCPGNTHEDQIETTTGHGHNNGNGKAINRLYRSQQWTKYYQQGGGMFTGGKQDFWPHYLQQGKRATGADESIYLSDICGSVTVSGDTNMQSFIDNGINLT